MDYQSDRFYHLTFLIGIMKASIIFHIVVPHISNVWSTKATQIFLTFPEQNNQHLLSHMQRPTFCHLKANAL